MRIRNHKMKVAAKLEWQCPEKMRKVPAQPEARRTQRVLLQVPIQVARSLRATRLSMKKHHFADQRPWRSYRPNHESTRGSRTRAAKLATAKEQECRVVHVRDKPIGKNEVGIAFPLPCPNSGTLNFPLRTGRLSCHDRPACSGISKTFGNATHGLRSSIIRGAAQLEPLNFPRHRFRQLAAESHFARHFVRY